jgi:hypothetical protein
VSKLRDAAILDYGHEDENTFMQFWGDLVNHLVNH